MKVLLGVGCIAVYNERGYVAYNVGWSPQQGKISARDAVWVKRANVLSFQ